MFCKVLTKKWDGSSKLRRTCPEDIFVAKLLRRTSSLLGISRFLARKFRSFAQMCSADPSDLSSTYPEDDFQGKHYLQKLCSSFFPDFKRKKLEFLRKVSFSIFTNYAFHETTRRFWEDLIFGDQSSRTSRTSLTNFKQKCSGLLWNTLGRIVKTQSYVSKSFFGEIWFPKESSTSFFVRIEQKRFGLLAKFFWLKCINAFYV